MHNDGRDQDALERQFDAIIAEYYLALERGEPVDEESFVGRHPRFQSEIREFLGDLRQLERVSAPIGPHDLETKSLAGISSTGFEIAAPGREEFDALQIRDLGIAVTPSKEVPGAPAIPGYRILEEIAIGGMGRVFWGRDLVLGRDVAIKTLLPRASVRRFVIEARITAQLSHPGIPPVHALGILDDGAPYLCMKLVRGRTLAALLNERQDSTADLSRFVQIFEQISQAVGFAHSRGFIHRDLKPLNVMVGEFGEVQVMDWGLAKAAGVAEFRQRAEPEGGDTSKQISELTVAHTVLGTPGYMSPEQARGEKVDERSDVFALGAILAAILTGKPAFVGETKDDTVAKAARGELSDVLTRLEASNTDKELVEIAKDCLSIKLSDRPCDGHEVASRVAAYRASVETRVRQIEAESVEAKVRSLEFIKRQRIVKSGGWVIASALVLGLIGTSIGLYRADVARAEAQTAQRTTTKQLGLTTRAEERERKAKEEVTAKKAEVDAALFVVEERTNLALETFQQMVFGIQDKLKSQPGNQVLRKDLLKLAKDGLSKVTQDPKLNGRPDRTLLWSHLTMGDIELNLGNSTAALKEFQTAHDLAQRLANMEPKIAVAQRDLSQSYARLGKINVEIGNIQEALKYYRNEQSIAQQLFDADLKNSQAQRWVGIAIENVAGCLEKMGRVPEALAEYEKMLEIKDAALKANPNDLTAKRDVAVTWKHLGDLRLEIGKSEDALEFYTKALTISQPLADADANDLSAQRYLGFNLNKLGTAHMALGRSKTGDEFFRKSLAIFKRLAELDPLDTMARSLYYSALEDVGKSAADLGQLQESLEFHKSALEGRRNLAEQDPENAQVRFVLCSSYLEIGGTLWRMGRFRDSLDYYGKALPIAEELTKDDPNNKWFTEYLDRSHVAMGDTHFQLGNPKDALDYYERALISRRQLAKNDPNYEQQRMMSTSIERVAVCHEQLSQYQKALVLYEEMWGIKQHLAKQDPRNVSVNHELGIASAHLGDMHKALDQHTESLRHYSEAIAVGEKLIVEAPDFIPGKVSLAIVCHKIGDLETKRFDFLAAGKWFAKGKEILDPINEQGRLADRYKEWHSTFAWEISRCRDAAQAITNIDFIFQQPDDTVGSLAKIRVKAMLNAGRPEEALTTAERFIQWTHQKEGSRAKLYYEAACVTALCVASNKRRDLLITQTINNLKKAKDDGYFSVARIVEFGFAHDFDAVRSEQPFVDFLHELEMPSMPAPDNAGR